MNTNNLKKLIQLIKKTGDRLVILDNEFEEPYVLMDLSGYEKLINSGKLGDFSKDHELKGDPSDFQKDFYSAVENEENVAKTRESVDFKRDQEQKMGDNPNNIDRNTNYGNISDTEKPTDVDQPVYFEEPTD